MKHPPVRRRGVALFWSGFHVGAGLWQAKSGGRFCENTLSVCEKSKELLGLDVVSFDLKFQIISKFKFKVD